MNPNSLGLFFFISGLMHMPLPARSKESLTYHFPVGPLLWLIQKLDNSIAWKKILFELGLRSPLTLYYKKTAYERTLISLEHSISYPGLFEK